MVDVDPKERPLSQTRIRKVYETGKQRPTRYPVTSVGDGAYTACINGNAVPVIPHPDKDRKGAYLKVGPTLYPSLMRRLDDDILGDPRAIWHSRGY